MITLAVWSLREVPRVQQVMFNKLFHLPTFTSEQVLVPLHRSALMHIRLGTLYSTNSKSRSKRMPNVHYEKENCCHSRENASTSNVTSHYYTIYLVDQETAGSFPNSWVSKPHRVLKPSKEASACRRMLKMPPRE